MLFNSLQFMIFFPIVVILYFMISYKYRWILLLMASYYFYMSWNPKYMILILTSTLITYLSGISIGNTNDKQKKKLYLILSLISNLGILFIFKYYNFSVDSINSILEVLNIKMGIPNLKLLLPVGISFYTFQALSYSMDVYRDKIKPEKHFGIYALYVSFFPQLVAGPIERTEQLLPQFKQTFHFEYKRVTDGLKLMAWGMFKKVVIADRLSILVNQVYGNPTEYAGIPLIIATVFFAFQIYCDFSGYSDIAIGAAQVMGFKLMDNFKRPYFSKSISEFWKRWHISLSTWFKDYLYISLGGNRVSKWRLYFNLFITFTISGLWHGANWTYVIWGALNGFYLVFAIWTKDIRENIANIIGLSKYPKIRKYWQVFVTFSLICFAWIFFRAKNLSEAWYIVTHLFTGMENIVSVKYLKDNISGLGLSKIEFLIAILSIMFMEFVHLVQRHYKIRHMLSEKPIWFRWSMYYAIILGIIFFGVFGKNDFIYFQF